MAGYPKKRVLFGKIKKTQHFRIIIPINFIDCKAWRHESECVKTMYLDEKYFISYGALMIAQISAVKMDTESGNLMEMTVFDGKTVAQAREFPSREPSV